MKRIGIALVLIGTICLIFAGCAEHEAPLPPPTPAPSPAPLPQPTPTPAPEPAPPPTSIPTPTPSPVPAPVPPMLEPPAEGDWIIAHEIMVQDKDLTLNGNLIVKVGGSLTLRDVKLTIASTYPGQYQILAEAGSSLFIYNTQMKPSDEVHGFKVMVTEANFVMKDSELRGGTTPFKLGEGDLAVLSIISTDGAIVENSTVYHDAGISGIRIDNSRNGTVTNNKIRSLAGEQVFRHGSLICGIAVVDSHNNIIEGNDVQSEKAEAIFLQRAWDNRVVSNSITSASIGIVLRHGSGNNIIDLNTVNGGCRGLWSDQTPFPNMFTNNLVKDTHEGAILSYTSNAIVAGNSFVGAPHGADGPSQALYLYRSSANYLINNHVEGCETGIMFLGSPDNVLKGNTVSALERAIAFHYHSDGNVVESNSLSSDYLSIVAEDSSGNIIRMNSLTAREQHGYDNVGNSWSHNYWSDYSGKDRGDGVGSMAYPVLPAGVDPEPLVSKPLAQEAAVPALQPVPYQATHYDRQVITEQVTLENQDIEFAGMVIEKGGSLTLRNVTLTASYKVGGAEYWLIVRSGGALHVDGSIIKGENQSLYIIAEEGATITIRDSTIRNLGMDDAVTIRADGAVIENNVFRGNYLAISIMSSHNRIINNTISEGVFGIHECSGSDNTIANNVVSKMVRVGMFITGPSSRVISNRICDVWERGINIESQNATVSGNTIENCGQGIVAGGNNNTFYHNNFIANRSHVGGTGNNCWYYEGEGNFWSDYQGSDANGDGIGDTPYHIGPHAVDNYPLMTPYDQ